MWMYINYKWKTEIFLCFFFCFGTPVVLTRCTHKSYFITECVCWKKQKKKDFHLFYLKHILPSVIKGKKKRSEKPESICAWYFTILCHVSANNIYAVWWLSMAAVIKYQEGVQKKKNQLVNFSFWGDQQTINWDISVFQTIETTMKIFTSNIDQSEFVNEKKEKIFIVNHVICELKKFPFVKISLNEVECIRNIFTTFPLNFPFSFFFC